MRVIDYCAHQRLKKDCLECFIKKTEMTLKDLTQRIEDLEIKKEKRSIACGNGRK